MKLHEKKISYRRIALILSLLAIAVWSILGTGASLAWFFDTSPELNNIFHFADFGVEVSYLDSNGNWDSIEGDTKIFDDEALYEPGYVQVVYLRIENTGDREFEFYTAVNVNDCKPATNVFGNEFMLQDYLMFGVVTADSEDEMKNSVSDREAAVKIADMPLHKYDTDTAILGPGKFSYLAVVVRMPEDVDNVANYSGDRIPEVELGITVKADQIKK